MSYLENLIVFQEARELLRLVHQTPTSSNFGDLRNQLERAVVSVVSNIAEGAAAGSNKQFARYLKIARASANEALAQMLIQQDLSIIESSHRGPVLAEILAKRLTCFIRKLEVG